MLNKGLTAKRAIAVALILVMLLTALPLGALATGILPLNVITSGQFATAGGVTGAVWTVYDDGLLEVTTGRVTHTSNTTGYWVAQSPHIQRAEFTGPITAVMLTSFFRSLTSMTEITGLAYFTLPITGNVSLQSTFQETTVLAEITGLDTWDTSNVTTLNSTFHRSGAHRIDDVSGWNTGRVTSMLGTFRQMPNLAELDLTTWDTSSATNMHQMFFNSPSLTSVGDLSAWDVSRVGDMRGMFSTTPLLTSVGDLSGWDTGSVGNGMSTMFWGSGVVDLGNLDNWDVSNVTTMLQMFQGATSLTNIGNLDSWNTGRVTTMNSMFLNTLQLADIGDLSGWDVSSVTSMAAMFQNTPLLTDIGDLSDWDTSSVAATNGMFSASGIESLSLANWDVTSVTNMQSMFRDMPNLTTLDLSGWDTTHGPLMANMFTNTAPILRELTLGEDFWFTGPTGLPNPPNNEIYTGHWINVGTGSVDEPAGTYILTSAELHTHQNANPAFDTWVWQRRAEHDITYTFTGDVPPNVTAPDSRTYREGTPNLSATLVDSPVPGIQDGTPGEWTFSGWTATNVSNSASFTMPDADVAFAGSWTFAAGPTYAVTYTVTSTLVPPANTITPGDISTLNQSRHPGQTVTVAPPLTTTSNANGSQNGTWTFHGWTTASDVTVTDGTFEMPAADVVFTGYWTFTATPFVPPVNPPPVNPPGPGALSPYHNSFLIGRPSGGIYPHANITRAEAAAVFLRLLNDETRIEVWSQENPFPDVTVDYWFNNEVSTMTNSGLFRGLPDGTFAPNRPITRAEVATIVARFSDRTTENYNAFSDTVGHWAEVHINLVADYGWVLGYSDGTFRPDQPITRAEFTAIVNRMLNRIPESVDALRDERTRWPDVTNQNAWYYLYMQEASHSTEFVRLANGYLRWTAILPHIDWSLLSRPDARPDDIMVARNR